MAREASEAPLLELEPGDSRPVTWPRHGPLCGKKAGRAVAETKNPQGSRKAQISLRSCQSIRVTESFGSILRGRGSFHASPFILAGIRSREFRVFSGNRVDDPSNPDHRRDCSELRDL